MGGILLLSFDLGRLALALPFLSAFPPFMHSFLPSFLPSFIEHRTPNIEHFSILPKHVLVFIIQQNKKNTTTQHTKWQQQQHSTQQNGSSMPPWLPSSLLLCPHAAAS
jgi:hypothetical protein